MLNKQEKEIVFRMLASALPENVQCSNEKSGRYKLGIPKFIAIRNYTFIQFSHPKKWHWLSVDIDDRNTYKTFDDIIARCKELGLPLPSLVVKTTKGWHIHWYLDEALWRNNKLHTRWRKEIQYRLNQAFGGDKHAAGWIFRNPFKHEYMTSLDVYTISDFEFLYSLKEAKKALRATKQVKKIKKLKKFFDFTKVKKGSRNNTLLTYIRTFMFRNFEGLTLKNFIMEGLRVNSLMPEPLKEDEVRATVRSAYDFVSEHYNPDYKNKDQAEYNRKLAKYKAQKTYLKALTSLTEALKADKISFFRIMRELYSFRFFSKLAGVSDKTIKKYIKQLKEDLHRIVVQKSQMFINVTELTFSFILKEYDNLFRADTKSNEDEKVGVLRC